MRRTCTHCKKAYKPSAEELSFYTESGGKAKTLVQMIAIGLYLLPMEGVSTTVDGLRWALMAVAVGLTVVTGLDYLVKALRPRSRTV